MEICKTKAIQEDLDIFWHILAYSDILRHKQAYSGTVRAYRGIFRALCHLGIFRTLVYSEQEDIQSRYTLRTLVYSVRALSNIHDGAFLR